MLLVGSQLSRLADRSGWTHACTYQAIRNVRVGVISIAELSHRLSAVSRKSWIWIVLAFAAVAATQIYYVREMLAALILISVLFVPVYAIVLSLFLFLRICRPVVPWSAPKLDKLA